MTAHAGEAIDVAGAAALLARAEAVTVLSHVNPDADTLGSALALALALERSGTAVQVSFPAPHVLPRSLHVLPRTDLIVAPEALGTDHELVVVVDCSTAERVGELGTVLGAAQTSLIIDHHRTNPGFGDRYLIDADAQSTCMVVEQILRAWPVEIDRQIATCLYAGLVTDTGGLARAHADSLRLAARLLETGIDGPHLLRELLDSHPFAWLPMLGEVLGRARLEPGAAGGRGLVHTVVRSGDAAEVGFEEVESVVDIVRTTAEAEVAAVIKEQEPGRWTVSLRSRGDTDVAAVAVALGGGGHRGAAGYGACGDYDTVLTQLREALG